MKRNLIKKYNGFSTSKKIISLILFFGLFIFLIIESSNRGDFHIFLNASKDLMSGKNIYETTYFDGFHYFYSLLFAIIIYPLTFLPQQVAVFLWLSFNILLIYRLYIVIKKLLQLQQLSVKYRKWFWVLIVLFSLRLVLENLHVAQITIFLLYLCLEGILMINHKKICRGSALIALGINIKLLPVVLLPYLLYRKQFKPAGLVIAFTFIYFATPLVVIGYNDFKLQMSTWLGLINPLNTAHILDVDERSFHGLTTLLSTLFVENVPDIHALKIKRNIANLSLENLSALITIVRLTLIIFTLYFLQSMPFQKNNNSQHRFWEISYILALIPLIFPHQQHYAFLFIAPAYGYCIYYLLQNHQQMSIFKKNVSIGMLVIIYFSINLKLLLGQFNDYYEHFKILTYGAIFLLVLLGLLIPHKTLKNN